MTCYAAEDGAPKSNFGFVRASLGAKTQAGYAPIGRLNTL